MLVFVDRIQNDAAMEARSFSELHVRSEGELSAPLVPWPQHSLTSYSEWLLLVDDGITSVRVEF